MNILSFGEVLFDIYNENKNIGGAPFNFSAHAVKAGAKVFLLTAVGDDDLGRLALEKVLQYKLETNFIFKKESLPTGKCIVTLNEERVPKYQLAENTAYDFIPIPNFSELKHFDALYFGTLALRCNHNRNIIKKIITEADFKEIFVDLNIRFPFYSAESILLGVKNASILKVSDEELPTVIKELFGITDFTVVEAAELIHSRFKNIHLLIITCGEKGSIAYDFKNNKTHLCNAFKTKVVSTVGAGDSFSATFLVNYLNGVPIEEALKKASIVSAHVVSREEAVPED